MKQKNPALDKLRTHLKKAGIIGGGTKREEYPYVHTKASTEEKPPQSIEEKERERVLREIPF